MICPYIIVAITVCVLFFPLSILTFVFILDRFCISKKKKFSVLFLVVVFLHSVCRAIYFAHWTYFHYGNKTCKSPNSGSGSDDSIILNIVGTIPEGFFLSAVSINIHNFAYLVYVVLIPRNGLAQCFSILQHVVNVSFYFWLFLLYLLGCGPYGAMVIKILNWIVINVEFINAGVFLFLSSIIRTKFPEGLSHSNVLPDKPSSKFTTSILFFASFICFMGLLSKSLALISNQWHNDNYEIWSLPLFFIFGEFIPECAMFVMQIMTSQYLNHNFEIKYRPSMRSLLGRLSTIVEEPSIYNHILSSSPKSNLKVHSRASSFTSVSEVCISEHNSDVYYESMHHKQYSIIV